jgi:hypothetical protein
VKKLSCRLVVAGAAGFLAIAGLANACVPIACTENLTCLGPGNQVVGGNDDAHPASDGGVQASDDASDAAFDVASRDAPAADAPIAEVVTADAPMTDAPTTDGPGTDASEAGDVQPSCPGVNLMSDPAHCGSCDHACGAGAPCSSGRCIGYTVSPSSQPFVDACSLPGSATVLVNVDNTNTPLTSLPFAFLFFGISQTQYWVNSNGVMGVGGTPSSALQQSCPLPMASNDHSAIYAFADDLITRGGGVCIATQGAAPNRQMVVTWEDAGFPNGGRRGGVSNGHLTFSVVLTETANTIDLVFQTMSGTMEAQGNQAAIGIEDSTGALAPQFSCNAASINATPMGVSFKPAP